MYERFQDTVDEGMLEIKKQVLETVVEDEILKK